MYEFKFEIFKYNYNLYLPNDVSCLKLADAKGPSLISVDLTYPIPKIHH
jgi:hypothetical protein